MEQHEMIALVKRHLKAEGAGDVDGAVALYPDDIVHDEVGSPALSEEPDSHRSQAATGDWARRYFGTFYML
jgi:hypothetical protein